jgi:hypothetical protein
MFGGVVSLLKVTVTASELLLQDPLVIVHLNVFAPGLSPETVALGSFTLEKVPVPLTTDQVPVPTVGALAASVVLAIVTF